MQRAVTICHACSHTHCNLLCYTRPAFLRLPAGLGGRPLETSSSTLADLMVDALEGLQVCGWRAASRLAGWRESVAVAAITAAQRQHGGLLAAAVC